MLRDTPSVGGRCLLVGGVASQAECPQSRSLFSHRAEFGLVLGHCLLALTHPRCRQLVLCRAPSPGSELAPWERVLSE